MVEITKDRTAEISNDIAGNNRKYKALTLKVVQILDDMRNILPTEYKELWDEMEDIRSKRDLLTNEILYRQGLMDGIKINNVYNELRNRDIRQVKRFLKM